MNIPSNYCSLLIFLLACIWLRVKGFNPLKINKYHTQIGLFCQLKFYLHCIWFAIFGPIHYNLHIISLEIFFQWLFNLAIMIFADCITIAVSFRGISILTFVIVRLQFTMLKLSGLYLSFSSIILNACRPFSDCGNKFLWSLKV